MSDNNPETNQNRPSGRRLTIGYLPFGVEGIGEPVWNGMMDLARERDVNLICFPGANLRSSGSHLAQANIVYEMIGAENVDGIVSWASIVGNQLSPEENQAFHDRYRPLPLVTIGKTLEGYPSVLIDNHAGMVEAVTHLIEVHGYRRLAFIRGPESHVYAQARFGGYVDALEAHGIALDERLVTPPAPFGPATGREAARLLLDERQLRPGADFDALLAVSEDTLFGALEILQSRGIKIPDDLAVVAFDDTVLSQTYTPPVTTVGSPFYGLGQESARVLLRLLSGENVSRENLVPGKLVVRQSCGCILPAVAQVPVDFEKIGGKPLNAALAARRQAALSAMADALGETQDQSLDGWLERLWDGLVSELKGQDDGRFLKELDTVLRLVLLSDGISGKDVLAWQRVISGLRSSMASHLSHQLLKKAENLWQQARVFIGETALRVQISGQLQADQQEYVLREIERMLVTSFDLKQLMDVLAPNLPRLGIPSCYLALYEEPQPYQYPQPAPVRSRLVMAYVDHRRVELEAGGQPFPTRHLIPQGLLPQGRQYSLIVMPLYFQNNQLGFVVFETGNRNVQIYETLRSQISSALQGALLVQGVKSRALQLQTAAEVSSAASSILDPNALSQQVVNVIRERFGLNYVGLFLVQASPDAADQTKKWAVLQAGTGEAGLQMVAQGHKLEIGDTSMVGWCVANKKARVALDVGKEAVHFSNPLLPDTHSEAALPLIARGEVIGAITVQSNRANAFDDGDVVVFQTMADQVAVAMSNAGLFEQSQQRAAEATKAKEVAEKARAESEREKERAEKARAESEREKERAEMANRNLAAQMWLTTGQALLNERMRGEQDVATLARNVIQQLCEYLNVQTGVLYACDDGRIKLVGSYAYVRPDQALAEFEVGEGLVGEAVLSKKMILLADLPDTRKSIASGLVSAAPRNVAIVPLIYADEVVGVVELGTLWEFSESQVEFLNKSLESVAVAFATAQARRRVNELLLQTRQQAEELQAQEEELRATNEELEAQTESLRASEARLKINQADLEAANVELEERAHALQEQQSKLDQQNQQLRSAQHELAQRADDLALASKYKSEFLANMSHELRTPLNSLLILSGMLAKNEEGNLTPDQVESVRIIYSGGTDLLNLINEILDLSKVEAGRMTFHFVPMSLESVTTSIQAQFAHVAEEKGVELILSVAEDVPETIESDQQRLEQIIKNLLSNAFKFTSQGSVRLDIYRPEPDANLSKSGLNPADAIAFRVSDTGIGMTPEQQKIVFEAFQQADGSTSRQYGGTGLGLTISREMAIHLGGQIDLQSEYGRGSQFTIYLPIAHKGEPSQQKQSSNPPARRKQSSSTQQSIGTKTDHSQVAGPSVVGPAQTAPASIADDRNDLHPNDRILLVIEDDPKFAKVVYNYAHKKHFKCLIAGDGETGLSLVRTYKVDAIVLDLSLPGISGWEVLDTLKITPETRHIPVHIMSVSDEDLSAYKRGAMGYIVKPVKPQALENAFSRIEQLIDRKIKSLLLVEDDEILRKSVMKLLEGNDVVISEAGQGKTALEMLAAQHFDCMILDLSLPDMSGFEMLNRINTDGDVLKCPVIVYTGKELSEEENHELLKYADSVIVKGVKSPERLLDETALFLHRVIANLPAEKQHTIRRLHDQDVVFVGKEILIVDDDARNAFALSKLLTGKGLKVHIAQNGEKALGFLDKTSIHLVLMDIMLPGIDGYEVTRRIRAQAQFRSLPILALTAKAMKGDREKCIAAGANDYLTKPVDAARLFSMLRVWLSRE